MQVPCCCSWRSRAARRGRRRRRRWSRWRRGVRVRPRVRRRSRTFARQRPSRPPCECRRIAASAPGASPPDCRRGERLRAPLLRQSSTRLSRLATPHAVERTERPRLRWLQERHRAPSTSGAADRDVVEWRRLPSSCRRSHLQPDGGDASSTSLLDADAGRDRRCRRRRRGRAGRQVRSTAQMRVGCTLGLDSARVQAMPGCESRAGWSASLALVIAAGCASALRLPAGAEASAVLPVEPMQLRCQGGTAASTSQAAEGEPGGGAARPTVARQAGADAPGPVVDRKSRYVPTCTGNAPDGVDDLCTAATSACADAGARALLGLHAEKSNVDYRRRRSVAASRRSPRSPAWALTTPRSTPPSPSPRSCSATSSASWS